MTQDIVDNRRKLEVIAGDGEGNPIDRAAEIIGISRRSAYNALDGKVSARTQDKIDRAFAEVAPADLELGGWSVGDVLGGKTAGAWRECIVANDGSPPFLARVVVNAGPNPGNPIEGASILVHVPPYIAGQTGVGVLIDEARKLAIRHLTRDVPPADAGERDRTGQEAVDAFRADLEEWGVTRGEMDDIADLVDRAEDDIREAAALGRENAMREARTRAGVLKRHVTRFVRSDF